MKKNITRKEWLDENGYVVFDELNNTYSIEHTYSTDFIMPMIGLVYSDFNVFDGEEVINLLINCYIDINEFKVICVCNNDNDNFKYYSSTIADKYINNKCFIISEEDNDEILLLFDVPDKYKQDFLLFTEGKYSKMSDEYKSKLVRFYGQISNLNNHLTTHFDVLYPTPFKKKQRAEFLGVDVELINEVRSSPDLKYENFIRLENLKYIETDRKILKNKYEYK
jgi:hypothetical protein